MPDFTESSEAINAAREWLDQLGDGEIVDMWQAFQPREYDECRAVWALDVAANAALERAQRAAGEDLRI